MPAVADDIVIPVRARDAVASGLKVALQTGGVDRPYAYGLAMALVAKGISVEVLGNDSIDSPEMHNTARLRFVNVWPSAGPRASLMAKATRTLRHYASLVRYAATAEPRILHILWNSKVEIFDRTLLMAYYKVLGKKVALTAHNVNQARRDGKDSWLNRLTLRTQYHLADHLFVHTQKMKAELVDEFRVRESAVTVIRHPINDAFPNTELSPAEAKRRLGLKAEEKAILCFGRIKPYKGIEILIEAFRPLAERDRSYRLVIAGQVQRGNEAYLELLRQAAARELENGQILLKTQFIPDEEMEVYLKAADALVLPYKEIFQSGVLFLGYSFGLPVIATDVGSFREEIVEGTTGYLCRPGDPGDLGATIDKYFDSDLYKGLATRRQEIIEYADAHHSWAAVAELTRQAYADITRSKLA